MYDGGSKIMGYILEKMMKGEENFERCNDFLVPVLSYTVKGLKEGKQYQFRVCAENAAGVSDPSRSTPLIKAMDAVGMNILLYKPLLSYFVPCSLYTNSIHNTSYFFDSHIF